MTDDTLNSPLDKISSSSTALSPHMQCYNILGLVHDDSISGVYRFDETDPEITERHVLLFSNMSGRHSVVIRGFVSTSESVLEVYVNHHPQRGAQQSDSPAPLSSACSAWLAPPREK